MLSLQSKLSIRFTGPGSNRFILQPAMAILLGVRDGIRDSRAGRPPYFFHLLSSRQPRLMLCKSALRSTLKPLLVAFFMDSLFQIAVLSQWSPLGMILVGLLFVVLPYVLARGISNRIASRLKKRAS